MSTVEAHPLAADLIADDERSARIHELCSKASMPEMARRFIDGGMSAAQVEETLFNALCTAYGEAPDFDAVNWPIATA